MKPVNDEPRTLYDRWFEAASKRRVTHQRRAFDLWKQLLPTLSVRNATQLRLAWSLHTEEDNLDPSVFASVVSRVKKNIEYEKVRR